MHSPNSRRLTLDEVALLLHRSIDEVKAWVKSGTLPTVTAGFGQPKVVLLEALEKAIAKHPEMLDVDGEWHELNKILQQESAQSAPAPTDGASPQPTARPAPLPSQRTTRQQRDRRLQYIAVCTAAVLLAAYGLQSGRNNSPGRHIS